MVKLDQVKTAPTLAGLKKSYSSALYSYFRITNINESYEHFRKDTTKSPVFRYSDNMSLAAAKRRLKRLHEIMSEIDPSNEAEIAFVEWRIAETLLLIEFRQIYESSKLPTPSRVEKYITDQEVLYGGLDKMIFAGIIRHVRILSRRRGPAFKSSFEHLEKSLVEYDNHRLFVPKEETFQHYKHLFPKCFPHLYKTLSGIRVAEEYSKDEIIETFEKALKSIGADKEGWKVVSSAGGTNIISAKYRKKLVVGEHFHPSSTPRFKQIVAHEVGCHIQRAINDTNPKSHAQFEENDEGLAVMLEQLLTSRFTHKRILRYLAICLAIGVDGKPRNFSEVYDILWRAAYIISGDKKRGKKQAFYEAARAFRGGIPSVAGMVYIKDKIYLESNLLVWEKMEQKLLGINSFRNIFRGHSRVTSSEQEIA